MARYIVRQGDSIISLSKRFGVPVDKILNHSANSAVRSRGRGEGILYPGDEVTIPDRETKEEAGATEARHRFRCTNRNTWLKVRLLEDGEPRAGAPYVLRIGTEEYRGELKDDGWLEVRVPSDTQEAILLLGEEGAQERIDLNVGHLNPSDEMSGVKQRLNNLGFVCGQGNEEMDDMTRQAIRSFQEKHGLEQTGELDENTRQRLAEVHGS